MQSIVLIAEDPVLAGVSPLGRIDSSLRRLAADRRLVGIILRSKQFLMNAIVVVFASNERYFPGLYCAVTSLLMHLAKVRDVDLCVHARWPAYWMIKQRPLSCE